MTATLLAIAAFLTSCFTAVAGIGGGVLLIAIMVSFMAPVTAIPVHGFVQLSSNVSRALFGLGDLRWRIVGVYAVGCVLGAVPGALLVVELDEKAFRILLAVAILALTWLPRPSGKLRVPGKFAFVGAFATFCSLFIGAAGPLSSPFFQREGLPRDALVVTHAAAMSCVHSAKIVVFLQAGFALGDWLWPVIAMIVASIAGSWAGTPLRKKVGERSFQRLFRGVVTLLALNMLRVAFLG